MTGDFQPELALRVLREHGVDFVCIGGTAAVLQGANYVTFDLDVCPEENADNLTRLSSALSALNARVRVEGIDEGFAFAHDGASLARARMWNLLTDAGDLDICFVPAGTTGYDDLVRAAVPMELDDQTILVASLDDIIRSKRAADRDKDRLALPVLEEIRDRLS